MFGSYTPPDRHTLKSHVIQLSAKGQQKVYDINQSLRDNHIKPGMAGDIWSSGGVSLLGLVQYHMTQDWKIEELLLAATPFGDERHTGEAIGAKTREACVAAGLPHDVFSAVFFPVSDNGSNMISGWEGFGRGPCCVHTGQRSVLVSDIHGPQQHTLVCQPRPYLILLLLHRYTSITRRSSLHETSRRVSRSTSPTPPELTAWVRFIDARKGVSFPSMNSSRTVILVGVVHTIRWNSFVATSVQSSSTMWTTHAKPEIPTATIRWGWQIG